MNSYDVSLTSTDTGNSFRFQLVAINKMGSQTSSTAAFILATVPDKPITSPTLDSSESTATSLKILIDEFTTTMNGGTDIIGYQIQIDDGYNGAYTTVLG